MSESCKDFLERFRKDIKLSHGYAESAWMGFRAVKNEKAAKFWEGRACAFNSVLVWIDRELARLEEGPGVGGEVSGEDFLEAAKVIKAFCLQNPDYECGRCPAENPVKICGINAVTPALWNIQGSGLEPAEGGLGE